VTARTGGSILAGADPSTGAGNQAARDGSAARASELPIRGPRRSPTAGFVPRGRRRGRRGRRSGSCLEPLPSFHRPRACRGHSPRPSRGSVIDSPSSAWRRALSWEPAREGPETGGARGSRRPSIAHHDGRYRVVRQRHGEQIDRAGGSRECDRACGVPEPAWQGRHDDRSLGGKRRDPCERDARATWESGSSQGDSRAASEAIDIRGVRSWPRSIAHLLRAARRGDVTAAALAVGDDLRHGRSAATEPLYEGRLIAAPVERWPATLGEARRVMTGQAQLVAWQQQRSTPTRETPAWSG